MNTIITIDLSKEVIPADILAMIRGEKETTMQAKERMKTEYLENLENWKNEIRMNINKDLIEKGLSVITVPNLAYFEREDICGVCKELIQEYAEKGYFTQPFEYAKSNFYKWYKMIIGV